MVGMCGQVTLRTGDWTSDRVGSPASNDDWRLVIRDESRPDLESIGHQHAVTRGQKRLNGSCWKGHGPPGRAGVAGNSRAGLLGRLLEPPEATAGSRRQAVVGAILGTSESMYTHVSASRRPELPQLLLRTYCNMPSSCVENDYRYNPT